MCVLLLFRECYGCLFEVSCSLGTIHYSKKKVHMLLGLEAGKLCALIIDYKSLCTLCLHYMDGLLKMLDPILHRMLRIL